MKARNFVSIISLIFVSFFFFNCSGADSNSSESSSFNGSFTVHQSPSGDDIVVDNPGDALPELSFCELSSGETEWGFAQGEGAVADGDGSEDFPHLICTAEQLANIQNYVNMEQHYRVMENIDVASAFPQWTPLGPDSGENSFKGTFDGNGFTISGINLIGDEGYAGLFGLAQNPAKIVNLHVNATITITDNPNWSNSGGIAGRSEGRIENSTAHVMVECPEWDNEFFGNVGAIAGVSYGSLSLITASEGTLTVSSGDCSFAGGLVGRMEGYTTITHSIGTMTAVSTGWYAGGVAGRMWSGTRISDSSGNFSTNDCRSTCGGVVGFMTGPNAPSVVERSHGFIEANVRVQGGGIVAVIANGIVRESSAEGSIGAGIYNLGGIVGLIYLDQPHGPKVLDSYANVDITCFQRDCGGAIGRTSSSTVEVQNVFGLGSVRRLQGDSDQFGGFVGSLGETPSIFEGVYYNLDVNDPSQIPYLNDIGEGLSEIDGQFSDPLSFPTFDFSSENPIWVIPEGATHPKLIWEN